MKLRIAVLAILALAIGRLVLAADSEKPQPQSNITYSAFLAAFNSNDEDVLSAQFGIECGVEAYWDLFGWNFRGSKADELSCRVVAISCNLRGNLLLFNAKGGYLCRLSCGQIYSVRLEDIDKDGIPELLTQELEGRGTGILILHYHLYKLTSTAIIPVWSAVSYSEDCWDPKKRCTPERGYVLQDPHEAGFYYTLEIQARHTKTVMREYIEIKEGKAVISPVKEP
jgi:hypothetical protein